MTLNDSVVVPVIMAAVELAKSLGLPKKFCALASLALGIVLGIFYLHPENIKLGIFEGVVMGLSAAGLYSGTKNTVEQFRETRTTKYR